MRNILNLLIILVITCVSQSAVSAAQKTRVFVVSSYDNSYLWSQSTQKGLVAAMKHYGYLDNDEQGQLFTTTDSVESSKMVARKSWMDTKRKNSTLDIANATSRIMKEIEAFKPDIVMLGDDNASNYIGHQLLDTKTPVVFWGINGLPLKYGLVDSMDAPGHNVTGVWQAGYHVESMELLKRLIPEAETFAIVSCDSVSARPKIKQIKALARAGKLPLKLVDVVSTNQYSEFQERVLELSKKVDAFFILNHDTMRDSDGNHVDMLTVGRWYLENINKPEVSHEDQFVQEGMLAAASDSGYNQSYKAFEMAYDVLEQGLNPGRMRTVIPPPGPLMVNRVRAKMLGISLDDKMDYIDEVVEVAIALN